jgi:hypothetical protein
MGYQQFSNDAAHKVRAVLAVSGMAGPRQTEAYVEACLKWYETLPHADRAIAYLTADAVAAGDSERAHLLADLLPRAPQQASRLRAVLDRSGRKNH